VEAFMILNVDLASEVPIYQQIRDRIVEAIADGVLTEGSPLPATRALAADFADSPFRVEWTARARTLLAEAVAKGLPADGVLKTCESVLNSFGTDLSEDTP
jgi:GntR family transcriptional regulator